MLFKKRILRPPIKTLKEIELLVYSGKKLKVLVTGGAGFIGSHLVDELLSRRYEVRVIDNLYSGNIQNVERHDGNPSFEFTEGDIRDQDFVEEALRGVDGVFHEAAITSVPVSVEKPDLTEEVNVDGTKNLLEGSLSEGVNRFVFASSCAIYGAPEDLPLKEDSRAAPASPYAESKFSAENKCREYRGKNGLEPMILRYFNVYGPGQSGGRYAGVISKFLERLEKDEPPIIYGDGDQTRDFVFVEDVVKANILALEGNGTPGRPYNIGSGRAISINELCEKMMNVVGKPQIEPEYEEARKGDIRHSKADLKRAVEELNYRPSVSLKQGLQKLFEDRREI